MIRVPTYQSSAGISSLPNVNTGNNYSLDSFGGGANQMPQAIDNFARAAQRLNLQIYNDHMEERQEVLDAEVMNSNIDYSTRYQEKVIELEQKYQGMDAKGVVEELDNFHTEQETALAEKYANNPKAQRAAMLHASRLRGDSGAWSVKHIRNQEQRILEDADNKQNALLVNSFPNMNPEQAEYFINMRAASMANTIYKGRPDAVETAKEKLKMAYMEQLAENKPGEFLSIQGGDGFGFAANFESAGNIKAIGYDKKGGTSYGTVQISSATMPAWFKYLEETGHGDVATRLREAGPINTGEPGGEMAKEWIKCVDEGLITQEMEKDFINKTHIQPTLEALHPDLQKAIASHSGLNGLLHTTAIQHGSAAPNLMNKAWEASGGDSTKFVDNLIDLRKKCFGSSTPEVRASVLKRLDREGENARASNPILTKIAQTRLQEQEKQQRSAAVISAADFLWTQLKDLPVDQQEAEGHKLIAEIEDRELAVEVGKAFEQGIAERKKARDANDWIVKQELLEAAKGKTISEQLQAGLDSNLSPKGKQEYEKEIMGEKRVETLLNIQAKRDILVAIGKGEIKDSETLYAEAQKNGLTKEQADACQNYLEKGGISGEIKYEAVSRAVQQLGILTGDKSMGKKGLEFKPELFDYIVTYWPPDLPVTEENLRREISRWILEQRIEPGWIFDSTYTQLEAAEKGKLNEYINEWKNKGSKDTSNSYGRGL